MRDFWEALAEAMKAGGRTLRNICEGAGVDYDRVKKARSRKSKVEVTDAVLISRELGYTLEEFLSAPQIEDRAEIVRIYKSLPPRVIRMLKAGEGDFADPDPPASPPKPS